ncbi:MAG: hypothetical protein LBU45_05525 [Azoarcus sp.]|jgi:hypothetical protein|nr:hypothetical protein [Azoarcus sp.]
MAEERAETIPKPAASVPDWDVPSFAPIQIDPPDLPERVEFAPVASDEPARTENVPPDAQTPVLFSSDAQAPETGLSLEPSLAPSSVPPYDPFSDASLDALLAPDTPIERNIPPFMADFGLTGIEIEHGSNAIPDLQAGGTQRSGSWALERPQQPDRHRPGSGRFIAGSIALAALVVILGGVWWFSGETDLQTGLADETPGMTSDAPDVTTETPETSSRPVSANAGASTPRTVPESNPDGESDAEQPLLTIPPLPSNQQQDNHNSAEVNLPESSSAALPLPLPFPPPSTPRGQTGNASRSTPPPAPRPVPPEQPKAPVREAVLVPIKMPTPVGPAPTVSAAVVPAPEVSSPPSGRPPKARQGTPSWLIRMREELSGCQSYFCRERVRNQYCTERWNTLPECKNSSL